MAFEDFNELVVWQKAYGLTKSVYRLTSQFPDSERYGLISQLRRCAVSIPSNIAEGACRDSTRDYLRFLSIARGSLAELETQLMLASDFGYGVSEIREAMTDLHEVGRILRALQRSLRERLPERSTSPLHHSTTSKPGTGASPQ